MGDGVAGHGRKFSDRSTRGAEQVKTGARRGQIHEVPNRLRGTARALCQGQKQSSLGGDKLLRTELAIVKDVLNRQEKTRARNPGFSQPQHREILNASCGMLEQM